MPIRFTCPQCRQRLSVPSEKDESGREVPSVPPGCAGPGRVHRRRAGTAARTREQARRSNPSLPPTEVDDAVQAVDVGEPDTASRSDSQTVSVPRRVVYLQGFLLGIVALVFFVFGMIVGSGSRSESGPPPFQPCTISGTVLYEDSARQTIPDESSIVIIVPLASRPDQKAAVEGLRFE